MIEMIRSEQDSRLALKLGTGPQQHATRKHAHSTDSLSVVVSGRTEVEIGFDRFLIGAGEFAWIPAGLAHLCRPINSGQFEFAVLYVTPGDSLFDPYQEGSPRRGKIDAAWFTGLSNEFRGTPSAPELHSLAKRCATVVSSAHPLPIRTPDPVPMDMGGGEPEERRTDRPEELDRFRSYRKFRARYSLGPVGVRQVQRIEHAIQLLGDGISIAEVAVHCGYYDQSHLVKVFRSYTGTTPSAYCVKPPRTNLQSTNDSLCHGDHRRWHESSNRRR